jgi:yeast amino acid transporter
MGIVIPYNDPTLNAILSGDKPGSGTSAASPYVIAMERLNISGLAHFFNAVVMTSVFSAGNGYVFSSSRALYTMAQERRAPAIFAKTTRTGVPVYAVGVSLLFGLLTLLNISSNTAVVMGYFITLVTMNQLLCYMATAVTFIFFFKNMKFQGKSRASLPYKGILQPYTAWFAICATTVMMFLLGFGEFLDFAPFCKCRLTFM